MIILQQGFGNGVWYRRGKKIRHISVSAAVTAVTFVVEPVKLSAIFLAVDMEKIIFKEADIMKRRFTGRQLFQLRNQIPVDWLIEQQLAIPCKMTEGVFRFLCPLCNEFQTATNPGTNLARCFVCQKNFNTIDLVMTVTGVGFVAAVQYLQPLLPDTPTTDQRLKLNQMLSDIAKPMRLG